MYIKQKKRVSIIMQAPSEGATTEQLAYHLKTNMYVHFRSVCDIKISAQQCE